MEQKHYEVESSTPFSESKIWQLNRDYYNKEGMKAWQSGEVPHYMTSNAMVGKTYAELIFGILKDLGRMGKTEERVYILEMGAGHGRLCFHILLQLEKLLQAALNTLPDYCYVLSDIAEDNLRFLEEHPQFSVFWEDEILPLRWAVFFCARIYSKKFPKLRAHPFIIGVFEVPVPNTV